MLQILICVSLGAGGELGRRNGPGVANRPVGPALCQEGSKSILVIPCLSKLNSVFQNHACANVNGAVAAGNPEIKTESEWPTPDIKAKAEDMEADHSE